MQTQTTLTLIVNLNGILCVYGQEAQRQVSETKKNKQKLSSRGTGLIKGISLIELISSIKGIETYASHKVITSDNCMEVSD